MLKKSDFLLRPMNENDLDMVLRWRNSERIRSNMYTDHIISEEEHQNWYKSIKDNLTVSYNIFEYKGRPVGLVYYTNMDFKNLKTMWGFYLGETDVPRGCGSVMEYFALENIFERRGFRKLCCEVFVFNSKVIKLHKKFGFDEEGFFKQHVYKNGKYEDVVFLSLFREKWLQKKRELEQILFSEQENI